MNTDRQRYTVDGDAALEAHLQRTCEQVLAGVQRLIPAAGLEGILLGGGYGRGEGGVLRTATGDRPYNDLEFYVFVRGQAVLAERRYRHVLHELGEQLSSAAGLEVEFKVLTLRKLRLSPPSMFYYDLVMGHRWLLGAAALLAGCDAHRDGGTIPLHEATRLLMNRCSGLLFATERLRRSEFTVEEADFAGRNLAKAQLAFGDVLLTAEGRYHWSCRERQERLNRLDWSKLAWAEPLRAHHAAGVAFKLHPTRSPARQPELAARHQELSELGRKLWLWLETRRLGVTFSSVRDYAASPVNKCPETSPWRNRLINFRAFGVAGLGLTRYPRERLLNALPLLLWETDTSPSVRRELRSGAADFAAQVRAYEGLWKRFN